MTGADLKERLMQFLPRVLRDELASCIVLTPEEAQIQTALIECVGLLPADESDRFWQNWRRHPYLDRILPRADRLAFLSEAGE